METLLDGRYELGDPLGSGGTGAVRRAHDRVLGRAVAVKLLHPGTLGDETHRARLREEARLAGALHHPGTAQVFDYGEDPATTPPTPYVVMQLVEGASLAAVLRDRRTLPVDEVIDLLEQVGAALSVAHGAGIVHRDLKPGNIVLGADGRAVLVDFGIARSTGGEPLTATGQMVGTVDYISPEQVAGGNAGPASDLYALGLVAYECLTGHKPFRRESQVATALAHVHDEAPSLSEEVPEGLRHLVARLIARDPDDRPASAADVAAASARLRTDLAGRDDPVTTLLSSPPGARRAVTARPRDPRRRVAAAAAAALLAGGLITTTFVGRDGSPTTPAAGASETRTLAPTGVRIPAGLVGQSWAVASERLRDVGLRPRRVERTTVDSQPGEVVMVRPEPGEGRIPRGTVVRLSVAVAPVAPVAPAASTGPVVGDGSEGASGSGGVGGPGGSSPGGGAGGGGAPGKPAQPGGGGSGGGSSGGNGGNGGNSKGKG